MSFVRSAFSSKTSHVTRPGSRPVPLSALAEGTWAIVVEVGAQAGGSGDRLLALGVTPGATVLVLQTFPGVVFRCDQTELAVERGVAGAIFVRVQEIPS